MVSSQRGIFCEGGPKQVMDNPLEINPQGACAPQPHNLKTTNLATRKSIKSYMHTWSRHWLKGLWSGPRPSKNSPRSSFMRMQTRSLKHLQEGMPAFPLRPRQPSLAACQPGFGFRRGWQAFGEWAQCALKELCHHVLFWIYWFWLNSQHFSILALLQFVSEHDECAADLHSLAVGMVMNQH